MKKFLKPALGLIFCATILTGFNLNANAFEPTTKVEETSEDESSKNEEETTETGDVSDNDEEDRPLIFRIYYECRGGDFEAETFIPAEFREGDKSIAPPSPILGGFTFDGWYTNKAYTQRIMTITDATPRVASRGVNDEGEPYIRLYAKWEPIFVPAPFLSHSENLIKGLFKIFFNQDRGADADGYELDIANDIDFSQGLRTFTLDTIREPATIKNKVGPKPYYFRARAFIYDETGTKVFSDYCIPKMFYMVNGADELEPTKNAAVITSSVISGGSIVVSATIENRIAADDDYYHVVEVDPTTDSVIGSLGYAEKDTEVTISFPLAGNLMAKFALAVKTGDGNYTLISKPTCVDNPEALASISIHPNPASKKGRQGTYNTGAGDKHYFHNFYLESIMASPSSYDATYNYNGRTYYFYNPNHVLNYENDIKAANADGGTVTMQIMLRWSANHTDLITPTGRTGGYNYYAFNVDESGARNQIEAAFMYLADYYSKSNRHIDNWILGNEVNTYLNTTGRWYWAGNISHDAFMTNYSETFRLLYTAVKSHNAAALVFTCCDHTWNNRDRDWGTMGFTAALDSALKDINPAIQWNLAYHAYTAVLTNSDPWNDGKVRLYSVAHSTGASFVSPYNLEVMSNYVAKNFPNTRIILSEVGFSSTGGTNPTLNGGRQSGASVQAAATAYLYYKAHFTGNIDACIFHTGDEGEAGKNFAIEYNESWNVYKYMDTPQYASYTNGYLGIINGASSWESIIPGFNGSALANLPNR